MLPFPGTVEVTWGDQSARDVVPTTGAGAAVELNHTYRAPGAYTVIVSTRVVGSDQLFSVQVRVVIVPPGAAVPDEPAPPGPDPEPEPPPPEIEAIEPDTGYSGTADMPSVVRGQNFTPTTDAFFGGFDQLMSWGRVTAHTPTELSVLVPDMEPGQYHVSVQDHASSAPASTLQNAFTVLEGEGEPEPEPEPEPGPEPALSSIEPDSGPVGTAVTLHGHHLGATETVFFSGGPAPNLVVVDDETVTCDVPEGVAVGTAFVVAAGGGQQTEAVGFTVSEPSGPEPVPWWTESLTVESSEMPDDFGPAFVTAITAPEPAPGGLLRPTATIRPVTFTDPWACPLVRFTWNDPAGEGNNFQLLLPRTSISDPERSASSAGFAIPAGLPVNIEVWGGTQFGVPDSSVVIDFEVAEG